MAINQILESIDESISLKLISQAYAEIASSRLKKIRQDVEKNRLFFDDLSAIYKLVKHIAYRHKVSQKAKNNNTLHLLITSNYHFYGNVNDDLIRFFIVQTTKNPGDKIVVGKTGQTFLQDINYASNNQPLILTKDIPSPAELANLAKLTQKYSRVLVYFSKMQSVLVQQPMVNDITQSATLSPEEIEADKHQPHLFDLLFHSQSIQLTGQGQDFLFEPDLIKMLEFFENQVSTLLLEQAFLESELSRTASRLISMDQAQSNADQLLSDQKRLLSLSQQSIDNERILELAGALVRRKKYGS